jgi:hypothetical protein
MAQTQYSAQSHPSVVDSVQSTETLVALVVVRMNKMLVRLELPIRDLVALGFTLALSVAAVAVVALVRQVSKPQ